MIKSFSGQVVFCLAIPEPYLLTLAKNDYPSILIRPTAVRIRSYVDDRHANSLRKNQNNNGGKGEKFKTKIRC